MKTIQIQFAILAILLCSNFCFGQELSTGVQTYEIAEISVQGNTQSETQAIISRSGLQIGKSIDFPGQAISRAIKALWSMQLFTDVQILHDKQANDLVYLKIIVKEAPRLGSFSLTGIKKSQQEELTKQIRIHLSGGSIITPHKKKISKGIVQNYFVEKGYPNVTIRLSEVPSLRTANNHDLLFEIRDYACQISIFMRARTRKAPLA